MSATLPETITVRRLTPAATIDKSTRDELWELVAMVCTSTIDGLSYFGESDTGKAREGVAYTEGVCQLTRELGFVKDDPREEYTLRPTHAISVFLEKELETSCESRASAEEHALQLEAGEGRSEGDPPAAELIAEERRYIDQVAKRRKAILIALRHIRDSPPAAGMVTLDREARRTLWQLAADEIHDIELQIDPEHAARPVNLDEAYRERREAEALFRALDEIGWAKDDPRERFTITVDETLREYVARWHVSFVAEPNTLPNGPLTGETIGRLRDQLDTAEPVEMCTCCGLHPAATTWQQDDMCLTCEKAMIGADAHGAGVLLEALGGLIEGIVDRHDAHPDDLVAKVAEVAHKTQAGRSSFPTFGEILADERRNYLDRKAAAIDRA